MSDNSIHTSSPTGLLRLISAAEVTYQVGWKVSPYSRKIGVLYHALSGSGVFSINGTLHPVKEGECFWLPPDATISLLPVRQKPFTIRNYKFLIYDPMLYRHLQNVSPTIRVDSTLESMLSYLFDHRYDRDPYNQWRTEILSAAILNLFSLEQSPYHRDESAFVITDGYSPATKKLLPFLESHLSVHLSLEEIGRTLGYNKNYLSSVFSKDTGISVLDYRNFHRARTAATDFFFFWGVSVSEACERLGFNSLSYFSRVFKKFIGVPPNDFFRACSDLSPEDRSFLLHSEPLWSYQIMPMGDLFHAMHHFTEALLTLRRSDKPMQDPM